MEIKTAFSTPLVSKPLHFYLPSLLPAKYIKNPLGFVGRKTKLSSEILRNQVLGLTVHYAKHSFCFGAGVTPICLF